MLKEIVFSGFGGQGVLTAGKLLMYAAYKSGLKVSWFPSYGNEMRGGSANCNVIISDERISSPYADHPDILVALNGPALERFMVTMKPGAQLFWNSSLIDSGTKLRADVEAFGAPVTDVAVSLGNERAANICMLGFVCRHTELFERERFESAMCEYFEGSGKGKNNGRNLEAFAAGYNYE